MANRRRKSGGRDILLSREGEREREGEEAYSIFPYVTCRAVDDARSFELRRVSAREFVFRFVVVVGCDCIGWKHKICTFAEKLN